MLGIALGLMIAGSVPYAQRAMAEEKKDGITQAELDEKLDTVIKEQAAVQKRLETALAKTQEIKAASGK